MLKNLILQKHFTHIYLPTDKSQTAFYPSTVKNNKPSERSEASTEISQVLLYSANGMTFLLRPTGDHHAIFKEY